MARENKTVSFAFRPFLIWHHMVAGDYWWSHVSGYPVNER